MTEAPVSPSLALVPHQVYAFTAEQIEVIKNTVAQGATQFELQLFLHYCEVGGFDPLRKQAYLTIQKSKCQTCYAKPENWNTPDHKWAEGACSGRCQRGFLRQIVFIPGIDGLMARAIKYPRFQGIRSGVVHLNDTFEFDSVKGEPVAHRWGVKDRGAVVGAWAVVYQADRRPVSVWYPLVEYLKSAGFVGSNAPETMLDKSAQAIALRRAFPDPFSTAYAAEEFGGTIDESGALTLEGAKWVHQHPPIEHSPETAAEPPEQPLAIEQPKEDPATAQLEQIRQASAAVEPIMTAIIDQAQQRDNHIPEEPRPTADWDDPDESVAQAAIAQAAEQSQAAVATAPPPVEQPAPAATAEAEINAALDRQVEGVLTYKVEKGVKLVQVNPTTWKPAEAKVNLTATGLKNMEAMFKDPKHRENHLMKYHGVATIPALTWEQLVATSMAVRNSQYDPRWYQIKIDEEAEKAAKAAAKERKSKRSPELDKVAQAYGLVWDDPLVGELLDLPDPLALAGLYDAKARGDKVWGPAQKDDLASLVLLVSTGQLKVGEPDYLAAVESVAVGVTLAGA